MKINQTTRNAMEQFDILFENVFKFDDDDAVNYDICFGDVFKKGINFSYMSSTFFGQFAAELFVGMLSSKPLRKLLKDAIDAEKAEIDNPVVFWDDSMNSGRFGIVGKDYKEDMQNMTEIMNTSYCKLKRLSDYFGTPEGRSEFSAYHLSDKDMKDMKYIICGFMYLVRRYDHNEEFAKEIMEHAGIVERLIKEACES